MQSLHKCVFESVIFSISIKSNAFIKNKGAFARAIFFCVPNLARQRKICRCELEPVTKSNLQINIYGKDG